MKHVITLAKLCVPLCLLAGFGFAVPQDHSGQSSTQVTAVVKAEPVRIGTFDSRGIALAYGRSQRSDCLLAEVARMRKEHDQAQADGNQVRIKELEKKAQDLQDSIHRQVFSGAPIPGILDLIKADLPDIAHKANVSMIVSGDVLFKDDASIDTVDITLDMCAPFKPDDNTVHMIKDLLTKSRVPESEISKEH